jgi:LuxR family transcriptional regulator, maltose regulon positive regulatory protein
MTDLLSRAVSPALLPLKLVPPAVRGDVQLRPDLQALLAEVRLQPVTIVVAPAGYGKTTLLTHWAGDLARTGAIVCWMGLDSGDQSPGLLLAYLVRAFQNQFPQVGEEAWRTLNSAVDVERDWPLVAGALFSDLQSELNTPTFLIFDDYQLIADGPITSALLAYLLRAAPPALHIVVASRRALTVAPLPRLRAEGAVLDVTREELSMTPFEARALLERNNVTLTDDELALLLERTEGWALSVQLAARALARQTVEQRSTYLTNLDSNQQSLFDYLGSEVLADLPDELINFMTMAALPDQFDALLLGEALNEPRAAALLERIRELGLPLTPIDAGGGVSGLATYRFHPLWRRLLRDQGMRRYSLTALAAQHQRFGAVFERNGDLEQAMNHYATAGDTASQARALREHAWPLINSPQREVIRRWIEQLPPAVREQDAELLHMWGWSQASLSPANAVEAISRAADLYAWQGAYQRELRALSDLAALLFWEERPLEFAAVCIRAVRAANHVRDAWARGTALVSVVALLYSKGRFGAALRVARQAAMHPRSTFWQWLLALIVSSIHVQRGHPASALIAIDEALAVPQIDRDDRLRQNLLAQKAMACFQLGQTTEASELALTAYRRLSDVGNDGEVGAAASVLALVLLEQGRIEEATTYLGRARSSANRTGAVTLLTRVQTLECYALQRAGQIAQATTAAYDLLQQLPEEGSAHDLWLDLFVLTALGEGGETERALSFGESLALQMERRYHGLFLAVVQLYRAALAARAGDKATSAALLKAGWSVADDYSFTYLPILPHGVLVDSVTEAIRAGFARGAVSGVLQRQLATQAAGMLMGLLDTADVEARVRAIELLGELGATVAYPSLRALLKDRTTAVRSAAETALERLVYRPMYKLRVRTLGAFGVWRGDDEVRDRDWRSVKARQLLQLLLVERGRMLPRDMIMDTLWPGLETEAAANNLRVTLSRLTKAIEPQRPEGAPTYYVIQQGETYGFNNESDYQLDVADFSEAINKGRAAELANKPDEAIGHYRRAISLYGGPFLPDCMYEDWSVVERERLNLLFNEASLRLGSLLLEHSPHEAIGLAWQVLEYDQAQEDAYRLLMRAYANQGERSTALRLYQRCVAALQSELGVEPLPETVELYEELRMKN